MANNLRLFYTLFFVALMGISNEVWTPPDELLRLCPYTSFCEKNVSQQIPSNYGPEFVPCCRPCSCSETCGLHGNCCHRDFNKYTENDRNEPVCRSTVVSSSLPTDLKTHHMMINKCSGGLENAYLCENNPYSDLITVFHPVYSPSKRLTYISEQCANCNNVTDGINWQMIVYCDSDTSISDDAEKFIQGKVNDVKTDCVLKYIPPNGFDLTFSKCEPTIRECNQTVDAPERDESWDLCLGFNATFIHAYRIELRFANIFCWKCNVGRKIDIPSMCPAEAIEDDYKQLTGMSWTVLLDMIDRKPQAPQRTNVGQCRTDEVFVNSFQSSCRQRRCPTGQILVNSKCGFYSSQWYGGPFSFLLKLTPLNNTVIPMEIFSSMPADIRSHKTATWLQRGVLKSWHVIALIKETENQTAVQYLITKITYPISDVDPAYLHAVLKQALKETWMLQYQGVEFGLKVELNDVIKYTRSYSEVIPKVGIHSEQPFVFTPYYSTGVYEGFSGDSEYLYPLVSDYVDSFETGIFLGQLCFCEQIDLLPEEYDFFSASIFFKLTNKTIYDANFRNVKTGIRQANSSESLNEVWTVRVCIDEFPDLPNRRDFSCQISRSYTLMIFVLFLNHYLL